MSAVASPMPIGSPSAPNSATLMGATPSGGSSILQSSIGVTAMLSDAIASSYQSLDGSPSGSSSAAMFA